MWEKSQKQRRYGHQSGRHGHGAHTKYCTKERESFFTLGHQSFFFCSHIYFSYWWGREVSDRQLTAFLSLRVQREGVPPKKQFFLKKKNPWQQPPTTHCGANLRKMPPPYFTWHSLCSIDSIVDTASNDDSISIHHHQGEQIYLHYQQTLPGLWLLKQLSITMHKPTLTDNGVYRIFNPSKDDIAMIFCFCSKCFQWIYNGVGDVPPQTKKFCNAAHWNPRTFQLPASHPYLDGKQSWTSW